MKPARRRSVRAQKLALQNGVCFYCGGRLCASQATLDHVEPVSRGGRNHWSNLVAACQACNKAKGNKRLREFMEGGLSARVQKAAQKEVTVEGV